MLSLCRILLLFSTCAEIATYNTILIPQAMEELIGLGKAKSIGVSNFNVRQLQHILDHCQIPPAVNQVSQLSRRIYHFYNCFWIQAFKLSSQLITLLKIKK